MLQSDVFVGVPNVGNRDVFDRLVGEVFDRRWFSNNGQVVQELEKRIADYLGVRHCITVCNATIGLQIAAHALGLTGEVITPAFTFAATPHSLSWIGLKPVFCDVDPSTHLMDPEQVESLITETTSAILPVHTWGQPCYPEQLQQIADRHGLKLYFDAAHAFGCQHNGTSIGNFGHCEVFSFHATKFFNTFEGGAITTSDDQLAAQMRAMINFGFDRNGDVVSVGTNAKMSEIHAAMGLACFETIDQIVNTNRSHYDNYRSALGNVPGLRVLAYDQNVSNFQYVVLEIEPDLTGWSRDSLIECLQKNDIVARKYFHPGCHTFPPYQHNADAAPDRLPVTEALAQKTMVLPTGTGVTGEQVLRVAQAIVAAREEARLSR